MALCPRARKVTPILANSSNDESFDSHRSRFFCATWASRLRSWRHRMTIVSWRARCFVCSRSPTAREGERLSHRVRVGFFRAANGVTLPGPAPTRRRGDAVALIFDFGMPIGVLRTLTEHEQAGGSWGKHKYLWRRRVIARSAPARSPAATIHRRLLQCHVRPAPYLQGVFEGWKIGGFVCVWLVLAVHVTAGPSNHNCGLDVP
jgi:hypothetical protein